jgi:hypothetical protein
MSSPTYLLFREAILTRRQVVCIYQGHERHLCPHALGYRYGREKALSFQFGGSSKKGLPPGGEWRCMFLDGVTDARLRKGAWHTGAGHYRPQSCVSEIDLQALI